MAKITVNLSDETGRIKPMHAVNNGPVGSKIRKGMNNFDTFREAGIPYARTHDASFCSAYGGEHTVDVHRIFKNFAADENDPASYHFEMTDDYIADIESTGCKVFFRLGASIEHRFKQGTYPPADFAKWARICEHIIRHYTEGWANGGKHDIEYWEIWNEPDCRNADGSNPCWQGTEEQFSDFFTTVFRHLKSAFPKLKIGGPAICWLSDGAYTDRLLSRLEKEGLTLDFFSFHGYCREPQKYAVLAEQAYELLKAHGMADKTELILNEWNYVKGWMGDEFIYSVRSIKGLKGASFTAASMCAAQKSKLDMFMYYDARPCSYNGMFDTDFYQPLKGYYPFKMFNKLYTLGTGVAAESDEADIYVCAAKNAGEAAVLLSYYEDAEPSDGYVRTATVAFDGIEAGIEATVTVYLLDETHDCEPVSSELVTFSGTPFEWQLSLPLFTTVLVTVTFLS